MQAVSEIIGKLRRMGGYGKARTVFAKNRTGKVVMTALIDEVRKYEALGLVESLSHHAFVELDIEGDACLVSETARSAGRSFQGNGGDAQSERV